jgi:hypothetical protein
LGNPRAKLLRLAQPRELAVGAEEGILHDLFRVRPIGEYGIRDVEHEAMTFVYSLGELTGALRFIAQARRPADPALSAF